MGFSIQSPANAAKPTGWHQTWTADDEPAYVDFMKALDEFSQSSTSRPWLKAVCNPSPAHPWTEKQSNLFVSALKQAPKALMVAPYDTVLNLFDLQELAVEQKKERKAFWDPFHEACRELGH